MLTYKQRATVYALKRNAPAPTHRKHALIARAAREGIDTRTISESVGISLRQVQRVVKAMVL